MLASAQLDVDMVLQKITDWMVRKGEPDADRRVANLSAFFRDRPDVCAVEPLDKVPVRLVLWEML